MSISSLLLVAALISSGQMPMDSSAPKELTMLVAAQSPPAPQELVVVSCKADDLTGQKGRHGVDPVTGKYDDTSAAHGWRDLELHVSKDLQYECKRETLPLEDATSLYWPQNLAKPLDPNFADVNQCARVGASITGAWQVHHNGWAVVAIGCPSMIGFDSDNDGKPDEDGHGHYIVKGWKLPGCPTYLPGTMSRMQCKFDASLI